MYTIAKKRVTSECSRSSHAKYRLGSGVCPKAVAKGFRCIFSNQGFWYLDHLDVPWYSVYYADPLEDITDASEQKLVLGGEVCMWGETADASNVQQTIWPRAGAAAGISRTILWHLRLNPYCSCK